MSKFVIYLSPEYNLLKVLGWSTISVNDANVAVMRLV